MQSSFDEDVLSTINQFISGTGASPATANSIVNVNLSETWNSLWTLKNDRTLNNNTGLPLPGSLSGNGLPPLGSLSGLNSGLNRRPSLTSQQN